MSRSKEAAKAAAVSLKEQNVQYEKEYALKMLNLWETKYRTFLNQGKYNKAHQALVHLEYWRNIV